MKKILLIAVLFIMGCGGNNTQTKFPKDAPDTMKYDGRLYITDSNDNWQLLDSINTQK